MGMTTDYRVHSGVPTGGQFAAHDRAEAEGSLPPASTDKRAAVIDLTSLNARRDRVAALYRAAQKEIHITAAAEIAATVLAEFPDARWVELGDGGESYDSLWLVRVLDNDRQEIVGGGDSYDTEDLLGELSATATELPYAAPRVMTETEFGWVQGPADPDYDWFVEDGEGTKFLDLPAAVARYQATDVS